MSAIKFVSSDFILNYLNENLENVTIKPPIPQQGYYSSHGIQVTGVQVDDFNNILNNAGQTLTYREFSFNPDNKFNINFSVNYNASSFNNAIVNKDERAIRSIYELSKRNITEHWAKSKFLSADQIVTSNSEFIQSSDGENIISLDPDFIDGQLSPYKPDIPAYITIDFGQSSSNELLQIIKKYGAYEGMIWSIHNSGMLTSVVNSNGDPVNIKQYDPMTLVQNMSSATAWADQINWVLGIDQESEGLLERWNNNWTQLDAVAMFSEIKDLYHNKCLRHKDLMIASSETRPAIPNEILCYRIEKYDGNNQDRPISIFYIPATLGHDSFVDTQIKYSTRYIYKIFAIMAIYSLDYQYQAAGTGTTMDIIVNETPRMKIWSLEIGRENVIPKSYAPLYPEVLFYNQSNVEKKIKLYLEPKIHEMEESFIQIEDMDIAYNNSAVLAPSDETKLVFKTSEQPVQYEIYKLNHKPKSYAEFKDSLLMVVRNTTISSSEAVEFFLTPNKKFYFMFRTQNDFRLLSNPSPVYEVELIQDADQSRITTKTINFDKKTHQRTRSFGRFLKVYPAFNQVYPASLAEQNTESILPIDQYTLGQVDHSIWGRKIKIRVRSKNTGKIIDFNVDFTLNKEVSEEDFS